LVAIMLVEPSMPFLDRAPRNRVEKSERGYDCTGRQQLDLEIAARHVVDSLGVVERIFVEDILGWPRALPPHGDRSRLTRGDHGKSQRRHSSGGACGNLQESAASGDRIDRGMR